jgi:ketosteroid isomerase-like protein
MPEQFTTADPVELARRAIEAMNRRDFGAVLDQYAPDAVWDNSPVGLGTFAGREAIRRWFEDWFAMFDEVTVEAGEILDLGNGVLFATYSQLGRPHGSVGHVAVHSASVGVREDGLITLVTIYSDIDEARTAAERLAESRRR